MATNFQASAIKQDNIIHLMKESGLRMRLYGDDTWIKMFPTEFEKSDPVSSFYVTDYTEVSTLSLLLYYMTSQHQHFIPK